MSNLTIQQADATQVAHMLLNETEAGMWNYASSSKEFKDEIAFVNNYGFRDLILDSYKEARVPVIKEMMAIAEIHGLNTGFFSVLTVFIIPHMLHIIDQLSNGFLDRTNYTTPGRKFFLKYNIEESFFDLNQLETLII